MRARPKPRLLSVVKLRKSLPEKGLAAGAVGTVVMVFDQPETAYEIEFCDDAGRTILEIPLTEDDFRVIG